MIKNKEKTNNSHSNKYKTNKKNSINIRKKYKNKKSVYSNDKQQDNNFNKTEDNLNKPIKKFNFKNIIKTHKFKKIIIIIGISVIGIFVFIGIYQLNKNKYISLENYFNPIVIGDKIIEIPGYKAIKEINVINTESSLDFIEKPLFLDNNNTEIKYESVILEDLEAKNAPSAYTKVVLNGNDFGMFIFTDQDGNYKYRCYAYKIGQKENDTAKYYGFVDVEFEPQNNGEFKITPVSDEFVDTSEDTFGQIKPMSVSEENLPTIYHYADGNLDKNLFYYIDKSGNRIYRVYGGFNNKTPHYYPADENTGQMIPGSLYVDISSDEQNAATYEELKALGIEVSIQEELEKRDIENSKNNSD